MRMIIHPQNLQHTSPVSWKSDAGLDQEAGGAAPTPTPVLGHCRLLPWAQGHVGDREGGRTPIPCCPCLHFPCSDDLEEPSFSSVLVRFPWELEWQHHHSAEVRSPQDAVNTQEKMIREEYTISEITLQGTS